MHDLDRYPPDRWGDMDMEDKRFRALDSVDIPHRIVKKTIPRVAGKYVDTEYTFAEHGQAKVLCFFTHKCQIELRGTVTNEEWAELIMELIYDLGWLT